jgi:uncharacterized protein YqiB (DUF1249 family)
VPRGLSDLDRYLAVLRKGLEQNYRRLDQLLAARDDEPERR